VKVTGEAGLALWEWVVVGIWPCRGACSNRRNCGGADRPGASRPGSRCAPWWRVDREVGL